MTVTPEDIVKGAASVARDAAEGRLTPDNLEAQLETELRALVGNVVGEGDPLFALQCDIARGVLAVGGVPTDELAEWAAVMRHRSGEPVSPPEALPDPVSLPSGPLSPENGDAEPEPEAPAEPEAATVLALVPEIVAKAPAPTSVAGQHGSGGYDPLAGWRPGPRR
ncbi:hypothetical protein MTY66_50730 [Mycolicibacterium sp. TY66]|uniref:flagellar hook-length control protein n=1 Tax=unclassified Mycolicibacterium TaxID=2636767 RepID=UPI001BB3D29D|nr:MULTISPECIES: flagellar hook-length control protein [unclassified Mycolicibacterium]BCI83448.1 hypothetical protein MTY66_50730 [Mycolicibacterium sp. TY66]BCJ78908.1 hypothetical protein MTY81_02810 [Mycolicibacterium sp. TY81]